MVGTGLPEELQAMLTESSSCTVTVLFRFMIVGISVWMSINRLILRNNSLHYRSGLVRQNKFLSLHAHPKM